MIEMKNYKVGAEKPFSKTLLLFLSSIVADVAGAALLIGLVAAAFYAHFLLGMVYMIVVIILFAGLINQVLTEVVGKETKKEAEYD